MRCPGTPSKELCCIARLETVISQVSSAVKQCCEHPTASGLPPSREPALVPSPVLGAACGHTHWASPPGGDVWPLCTSLVPSLWLVSPPHSCSGQEWSCGTGLPLLEPILLDLRFSFLQYLESTSVLQSISVLFPLYVTYTFFFNLYFLQ